MNARTPRCTAAGTRVACWLLLALGACCGTPRIEPAAGEQPFAPPRVQRHHDESALVARGAVPGAPFATLREALAALPSARVAAPHATYDVFVVTRGSTGWLAQAFHPGELRRVAVRELGGVGMPLGPDPAAPLTFAVDSDGWLAALQRGAPASDLAWEPVRIGAGGGLEPAAGQPGLQIRAGVDLANLREPAGPADPVFGFVVAPAVVASHAGNQRWSPSYALRPGSSLATLSRAMGWIARHLPRDVGVRAVGSRHSWSPVGRTEGVMVLPDDTCFVERVRDPVLGKSGALFRVGAGVKIRELNEALQQLDLAIPWLGGFDGQTMGGVFATGTHGSVGALGPLADMIRSIDLVRFDGTVLRIEPARDAILSHPIAPRDGVAIELRADDELFDAARLGLGTLGVIHSLVLETVPKYWLREVRTATTLAALRPRLAGGGLRACFADRQHVLAKLRDRDLPDAAVPVAAGDPLAGHALPAFHFELLWNPYEDTTLVTSRHWIGDELCRRYQVAEPREVRDPGTRSLVRLLEPCHARLRRPGAAEFLAAHGGKQAIELIEFMAANAPQLVPELVDNSIKALVDPDGYIGRSYRVFNIGDAANALPALSATFSVPLRDDLWLRAADIIAATAKSELASAGRVQTGPIALRFVAASSALLADPEDVCKFEVIFGGTDAHMRATAEALVASHILALRRELGDVVRVHFGQLIPDAVLAGHGLDREFPRVRRFRELRDQLDPDGRGLSPWLRKLLLPE